jgi:hypothetical protein
MFGYAAWRIGRRFSDGQWIESILGAGVLFYGFIVVTGAVTGFFGLLNAAPVWNLAGPVAIFTVSLFISHIPIKKAPDIGFRPVVVFVALFIVSVTAMFILVWDVVTPPPAGGDAFIYHLTFPASWLKTGRIAYVPLPYGAQAATYYPLDMELFFLWIMRAFQSDLLVNLAQVPCWLIAALGVAAISRETGVGRPGAIVGAAFVMLAPGILQQVTVARVDVAFASWFVTAIYFALRFGRTKKSGSLVLFGVSIGLLIGTKPIGVTYAVIPLLLFFFNLRGRGFASAVFSVFEVAMISIVFGGFWHIRNWIATGNPFFPLDVNLLGWNIFPGAYGKAAMKAFHSTDPRELLSIGHFFLGFWIEEFLLFTIFVSVVMTLILGKRRASGRLFLMLVPWFVTLIFWFVNPYNNLTNGRFLFPAVFMFGYYIAVIVDDLQDWTGKTWGWLALAAIAGSSFEKGRDNLPRLISDIAGLAFGAGNDLLKPASGAIVLVATSIALVILFLFVKRNLTLSILTVFIFLMCLGAGLNEAFEYQNAHKYEWYRGFPVGRAWASLDKMTHGKSLCVASVGNERMYGLFGAGLRHDVITVNVDKHTDWQFHDYWRSARLEGVASLDSERPQYHRNHGTPDAWMANLRKKHVDIVFATTLEPIAQKYMGSDSNNFPVEVSWAEERPDVFKLLLADREVRVFAVKPDR